MKYVLLIIIWIYWRIIPEKKRRRCLFKESCSCFVYRITATKGAKEGILALNERFHQCRSGYKLLQSKNNIELHLKDGTVIKGDEISQNLTSLNY
jgi:putative component of membrane protein insertase Oxa1/YidC/SpoIIIJ protein YidD